jgi:hypothetical protein
MSFPSNWDRYDPSSLPDLDRIVSRLAAERVADNLSLLIVPLTIEEWFLASKPEPMAALVYDDLGLES